MRVLYVDGDAILWRVVEANQEETWWPGSTTLRTAACHVRAAASDFDHEVGVLWGLSKADNVVVVLGPQGKAENFRRKLWPEYKMHRRRADAPVGLHQVRELAAKNGAIVAPVHLEADDVLGQMMTEPDDDEKILWSPDKDMLQIPGLHMDDAGHITTVSKQQGDRHHLLQTLTGDTSDGYPGCKGIGPVKAQQILDGDGVGSWWTRVVQTYKKAEFSEAFALNQARVARILRYGEEPGQWRP